MDEIDSGTYTDNDSGYQTTDIVTTNTNEICDEIDNDQDGQTDSRSCQTVCGFGGQVCDENGVWGACNAPTPRPDGRCDTGIDTDHDGFADEEDNCPMVPNPEQVNMGGADADSDGIGDACDNCPLTPNWVPKGGGGGKSDNPQADIDHDGIGNICDNCPTAFNPDQDPFACAGMSKQ